jgi:RNA polymerase sigma factor (sigma-70 family)
MEFQLEAVWQKIRRGDSQAWGELVKEYAGLVYGIARRAGLDKADAEDCAQFAWLALYRNRQKIRNAAAVPAWLVRTVRRRSLRVSTRLRREMPLDSVELPIQTDEQREGEFAEADLKNALHEALEQLDPRCRELLVHLFSDDQPALYRDLAERMGVAANTIGPMRSRCLGRLKKILNKMGWELH